MKTLYLECGMGAAGDMLTAALLELCDEPGKKLEKLNSLGIPGVVFSAEVSEKCGIRGTGVRVSVNGTEEDPYGHHHDRAEGHSHGHHEHHEHGHSHSDLGSIEHIVNDHLDLPENVKKDVVSVFGLIAEAESHVHGVPVPEIHFHEVGTMDAVADVTAVCLLMNELSPDRITASPVHVGSGQVRCAHGILPVPAPATAYILRGVPSYGGSIGSELCTPTGAALIKYFVSSFGPMPVMSTEKIGYGMGKKDFPAANCVRAMLGDSPDETDTVTELSCNVDDMTAEAVGYAVEKLLGEGALDVYTVPVMMKKGRPGTLIKTLCRPEDQDRFVRILFSHTSTIGIRKTEMSRFILSRSLETIVTPYGEVRQKVSSGYGAKKTKYEYADLARIADERGIGIAEVTKLLDELK
ncbi:MAG: nickel pincer cofactor biosynthesis protein LarC [Clostridia bacterium]|nr:nickel pincer cofactor biosynthesis protein LarC [Clostridia bacterium]